MKGHNKMAKTYEEYAAEAQKSTSKIKIIPKLTDNKLLLEVDKLVRTYCSWKDQDQFAHHDDPEWQEDYHNWCRSDKSRDAVTERIREYCEFEYMHRDLERCCDLWLTILHNGAKDTVLF